MENLTGNIHNDKFLIYSVFMMTKKTQNQNLLFPHIS